MSSRNSGIILCLIASGTFGLISLFTLPLLQSGINAQTILVYRFVVAVLIMWPILAAKGEKLRITLEDFLKLMILSSMYLLAVITFFYAFSFLASGVVAIIQFLYPVMVMLVMVFFFHEKFSGRMALALILAFSGVTMLAWSPDLSPVLEPGYAKAPAPQFDSDIVWGLFLALLSALGNCFYYVGIQVARIPHINGLVMTFYVMAFGALFSLLNAIFTDSLVWISGFREIGLAFSLALVTAVISNLTLILSIKRIGSTMASVLGVSEPVTAVLVGILVFGEPFSINLALGMLLIAVSVGLVVLGRKKTASS